MLRNEVVTSRPGSDSLRLRWLLLVLVVALGLRVAWLTFFTKAINGEGAEYARIAENLLSGKGYVGIATDGPELMLPPFFPLMIAVCTFVAGSPFLAAQLVALAAGMVLLLAMYGIAQDLYGETAAFVAVVVAALHPVLIKLSATAWVEGPYIALVMVSVYFMNRARSVPGYRSWAVAGVFAGLAYLTSPQALLFPFVFLVSQLLSRHSRGAVTVRRAAVLAGSFAVLALPYVAFLSSATGTLRLEGKTIVNTEMGRRLLAGASDCLAGYEVTENLEAKGVWMRPNTDIAKTAGPEIYGATLSIMASKGFHNIAAVADAYATAPFFGAPLIALLAALGLLRSAWSPGRTPGELLLVLVVLGGLVPLMTVIHWFHERFYFFLVPFLLIWGAKGIAEIAEWSRDTLSALGTRLPSPRMGGVVGGGAALAGLLVLFAIGFDHVTTFKADSGAGAAARRDAGDWLAAVPGEKTVMDTDTPVAFHAGARYVPMPCSDSATALRFAEQKKVDYIILQSRTTGTRPYLQDWWSQGVPTPNATLVHSAGTVPALRVLVFKLDRAGAPAASLTPTRAAADGPLRPSPANSRYFGGRDGKPIYLTGAHAWTNFQDRGPAQPPVPFDYGDYLDFLERSNHNLFRLWTWENARWAPWSSSDFFFDPMPFERTGPGVATASRSST